MHYYPGINQQEYYDAIRAGNPIHFKMYFPNQNVTLTEENININYGVTITDIMNGDDDLCVGKAVCQQFEARIILDDNIRKMKLKDKFSVAFGIEIEGDTKWVWVGEYIGIKPRNVQIATEIDYVAYDTVLKFDIPVNDFLSTLEDNNLFPISTFNLVRKIANYTGISITDVPNIGESDLVIDTTFTREQLKQFSTIREMLAAIAEATCTYFKLKTAYGSTCKFMWFGDEQDSYGEPGYNVFPLIRRTDQFANDHADLYDNDGMTWGQVERYSWNSISNLTWDYITKSYRFTNRIDTLYMANGDSEANVWKNNNMNMERTYSVIDNLFTKGVYIYPTLVYPHEYLDRLYDFGGQLPMIVECTGNWMIETGDYVDVEIENNEIIHMPVYSHTLHYNGSVTSYLETTGEKFNKLY